MKADNIQELSPLVLKVNNINLRLLYHARKQMKRTVYDTSYVKTITTGTEENMEKVKALSEHYVIRNAKRASKLIEDMKKKTEKEKVDLLEFYVNNYSLSVNRAQVTKNFNTKSQNGAHFTQTCKLRHKN